MYHFFGFVQFASDFQRLTGVDGKEKIKLGIDMLASLARKRVVGHEDVFKEIQTATRLEQQGHALRTRRKYSKTSKTWTVSDICDKITMD